MCVDFKYDPEVTFRERSAGCGFELYPPPSAQPSDLSSPSSSSTTPMSMSAMAAGEGERKEEEEEGGRGAGTITGWRKGRRRWVLYSGAGSQTVYGYCLRCCGDEMFGGARSGEGVRVYGHLLAWRAGSGSGSE